MRKITILLSCLLSTGALACPNCAGDAPQDQNTLIVIAAFIAFTYVPMFLFYKLIRKYSTSN